MPLVNILIVYSNKIHSCQTATATRTAEKAIGLISKKKKRDNFARAAHFFVHFFAVVLHDYVLTCTFYSFYGGNSVCAELFLTCSRLFLSLLLFSFLFFFFTAAHYNLGRCLFSHRAARKLSCSSSNEIYNSFAVFTSRSSSFFCYQRQCRH